MAKRVATEEAIEYMRNLIDPEQYRESLNGIRRDLLRRSSEILAQYDLNEASPEIDEEERVAADSQIANVMTDIAWRLSAIDEKLVEAQAAEEAVKSGFGGNRAQRRRTAKTATAL